MKVCFETFGCRLNRAEALEMEAAFLARGWSLAKNHEDADLVVIRGCAVTSRAEAETARMAEHLRTKYPMKRVIVTGCVRQRRNEHWLKDLPSAAETPVPVRTARAWLKVQDGCAGKCSFCTVPRFRGAPRSVPLEDAVARAERFVEAGYREIVVTGCSLSQYLSGGKRLADLIAALAAISRDCRIRLGSLEPSQAADDAIRAVAENPNACRNIHLAVQSGSMKILSAMRRPYTARKAAETATLARSLIQDAGLGCDMISGFPGETDSDHLSSIAFLKHFGFVNVHAFPYSERPGTAAATLPGAVPRDVRAWRSRELATLADRQREKFAARFKGRTVEIVVENEKNAAGWTPEYLWCSVSPHQARSLALAAAREGRTLRKSVLRVHIDKAEKGALEGAPAV